jgi:serine/threonine protein kinase
MSADRVPKPVYSPEADVWSLGCIYSEAVTWLIEGYDGLLRYRQKRSVDGGSSHSPFHNGKSVLEVVSFQNTLLQRHTDEEDDITKKVISQMIEPMLKTTEYRPTASKILRESQAILDDAPSLLSFAARRGDLPLVKQILATKNIDTNSKDGAGWTPLAYAAYYKSFHVVRTLLQHGAISNLQIITGLTPRELVEERRQEEGKGDQEIFRSLLSLLNTPQAVIHEHFKPSMNTWPSETGREQDVCREYSATIRFYSKYTPTTISVWDLIYNKNTNVKSLPIMKESDWQWLHLPANNVCLNPYILSGYTDA